MNIQDEGFRRPVMSLREIEDTTDYWRWRVQDFKKNVPPGTLVRRGLFTKVEEIGTTVGGEEIYTAGNAAVKVEQTVGKGKRAFRFTRVWPIIEVHKIEPEVTIRPARRNGKQSV